MIHLAVSQSFWSILQKTETILTVILVTWSQSMGRSIQFSSEMFCVYFTISQQQLMAGANVAQEKLTAKGQ